MARPNILFLHSDQHRADCISSAGHPILQTPRLDELAAEGARFTHAFCPVPVCTPARISLLTGMWPFRHGCLANANTEAFRPQEESLPVFTRELHASGYHVAGVGKWHAGPMDRTGAFGFDAFIPESRYPAWRAENGLGPLPRTNGWFGETDTEASAEQSRLAWGAGEVINLLENAAGREAPFFIRWDPSEPHLPNCVPEPYASLYPPETISPWASFSETFAGKPFIQHQQLHTWGIEEWGWNEWAPIVSRYLGEIALMDAQIGRVLDALDRLGLRENTLVVYSSDHGDMCGAHRMIDKHYIMYDDVVRVPLIVRWPGTIAPGKVVDDFVCSALDLASTFCDAAEVETPETFMGESLLPLAQGSRKGKRKDIFAAYHGNQLGLFTQRMVRDRKWKYVWNATAEDELYHLESDPAELENRAGDPACAGELSRLRKRMITWMEETRDPVLNEWTRGQLADGRKRVPVSL